MNPRTTLLGYEPVDATGRDTEEDREAEWITPDRVEFSKFAASGLLKPASLALSAHTGES